MKKIVVFGIIILSVFVSFQSADATVIKNKKVGVELTMNVEKKSLGWHITITLENKGDDWIYVEKNGYGDIGCIIYDEQDNEIWWTYNPDDGSTWQIGPGATYESFTIWTGVDMNKDKVEKGKYEIVGAAGYFVGGEYVPLLTDPYTIEVSKERMRFLNLIPFPYFFFFSGGNGVFLIFSLN